MSDAILWIKKHPIKTTFIGIFVFVGLPFIIQLIMIMPSAFANAANNDWIGFWGGYLGAIVGGGVTLIGIYLTIKSNEAQLTKTIELNKEITQATIDSNRKQMIEEKRIENSVYFFARKIDKDLEDTPEYDIELNYNLNHNKFETNSFVSIGIKLINISNVSALDLRLFAMPKDGQVDAPYALTESIEILRPNEEINLDLVVSYDDKMIRRETKYNGNNEYFSHVVIIRVCYDTGYDIALEKFVDDDSFSKSYGRANSIDIYCMSYFSFFDDKTYHNYSVSTKRSKLTPVEEIEYTI